jgi:hypothetical protein
MLAEHLYKLLYIGINPNYVPMYMNDYPTITNTSCIIIWYNPTIDKYYYLLQKRGLKMKTGAGKLAIGGGHLESSDTTLQMGACREIMEESQVLFNSTIQNTMTFATLDRISKNLFYLSQDATNVIFFLILVSKKMPIWKGPINRNIEMFKKSSNEIDQKDYNWGDNKLIGRVKFGHCFLTKKELKQLNNQLWHNSNNALLELFVFLDSNE